MILNKELPMNYFEEEYLHIKTEESIAIMQWLGLAKTEAYRSGWDNFAKLIDEQNQPNWLLDFSGGKVIDIQDQKWTSDEWVPHTMDTLEEKQKRPQKVAVILSTDIFNKVAVRVIMGSIEKNSTAEIAYFETEEEAISWFHTTNEAVQIATPADIVDTHTSTQISTEQVIQEDMSSVSDANPSQETIVEDDDDLLDDFEFLED